MANGHANGKKNGNGHSVKKSNGKRRHVLGPGPGRPKGVPNKATLEVKQFAREFLTSEEYRESLKRRILQGKALTLEVMLSHYGFGVPKQSVEVETKGEVTHKLGGDINAKLAAYDAVLSKLAQVGAAGSAENDSPREPVDPKRPD